MVSAAQLNQNLEYVEIGKGEGARLVMGGERLERPTKGFYMQPALFADVDNDMRIAREEIFGPVAAVIPANDRRARAGSWPTTPSSASRRRSTPSR